MATIFLELPPPSLSFSVSVDSSSSCQSALTLRLDPGWKRAPLLQSCVESGLKLKFKATYPGRVSVMVVVEVVVARTFAAFRLGSCCEKG